ncbi:bacteriophage protein [Ameyamaea chiangmaiensis NBRC 103196]|uniref:Phage GP46 family protein n=1 Tax=Ameyamaea chiangmaiensis TaxID=442969 RepID=A0A850PAQ2_9PROT|nr:phage GP46 family protein [Ameyamaea chiangmaiensis]MBS4075476.1 phage GP46 family protein [Ameyamaea chiangmaiensis]NVN38992.1 phage GP46 family protein [Ameyamaea chiangmaiensis]GBQ69630.1 bacteriophage protein [Ameyamaea chiangmaiensis NBRC 103196]
MDIAIDWNVPEGRGDWRISDSDIALDNPLRTAVMVSLFTDRLAPVEPTSADLAVGVGGLAPGEDRRGWWGDAFSDGGVLIGSRLWLLRRVIKSGESAILMEVQAICNEALAWLVTDQVVASVAVTASWLSKTAVGMVIVLTMPDSTRQSFDFSWAWKGLS